ncbi:MAG: EI24 domain-containing protein [Rickettsiales bacterium]
MLAYLSKAISQIGDPVLRRVVLIGIGGSGLVFVLLSALVWWIFSAQVDLTSLSLWDWVESLLDWIAGFVVVMSLIVVSAILFPGVATIIVGFFLEDVVAAVEKKHYPGEPPARPQPVSEVLASTVRFALSVIGLNLLCLPLYLILMFVPPFNLVLYYLLNGYLVSREYFELVALRRMGPAAALQMRRQSRGRILMAGILLTFLLTIPIINFLTPVIATAFMVHVFHGLPGRQEILPT